MRSEDLITDVRWVQDNRTLTTLECVQLDLQVALLERLDRLIELSERQEERDIRK